MRVAPVALVLLALSVEAAPKKPKPAGPSARRELVRRTVTVTDDTRDVEVHVARGVPTSIVFPVTIARHLLLDARGYFPAALQQKADRLFVLLPDADVPTGEAVSLQVTLIDGTLLAMVLTTLPDRVDMTLEVEVDRKARATADSASGLKAQVAELQGRLDACQQSAGEAGARKVAELVLRQDPSAPAAFVVERHAARTLDKQARLLVETLHIYRLFDLSYLVLTIENRDPSKLWVLDRVEVGVVGGGSTVEARVVEVAQELSQGIPPAAASRVVVAFVTPEQAAEHRFSVKVLEKDGNRHVELTNLKF